MQYFIFGAVLLFTTAFLGVLGGDGCMKDFKNKKDIEAAIGVCKTKLGLKDSDIPMPSDITKNGFDDKCLMKCIMTELKYVNDDGTVDLKAFGDSLKTNAPTGKADALLALMKDCADTTAKDATISKDPCKAVAKTKICYMMGQDKICPPA